MMQQLVAQPVQGRAVMLNQLPGYHFQPLDVFRTDIVQLTLLSHLRL
jgi:hypothetical protein